MINRKKTVHNILKRIWITVAIIIIALAVFSSIFRSLTPWAKQYKGEVEFHLSQILGQPITIQSMETGWYWFQPVLKLKRVTINEGAKQSLHLEKLLVGINLFKSLWNWRIQPGILYVDDLHLIVREKDNQWSIDGISSGTMKDGDITQEKTQRILIWLSQQERLVIRHISVFFHFNNGGLIPVSGLNVSVVNHGGEYKIRGEAKLEQTNSTFFQLLGHINFDPYHLKYTKGQFYFSAKNVVPAQWQSILPKTTERIEGGKGDIELWLDLNRGIISSVQSQVKLNRFSWRSANKNSQMIQKLYANLSWKPEKEGWLFQADHIQLRVGEVTWPENQLLLKFDKIQQSYQLFVKSIIIESLLSQALNWPASIMNVLPLKPQGTLRDTQVLIKNNQPGYILTRFNKLGWNKQNTIPAVKNLSGVLDWQPDEGRLEVDSENMSIALKGYPTQNLTLLNGALDWKELSHGLRVSIERLVLSKPDLTVSTEGVIDQVTANSMGNIRMTMEFSGRNLQKIMPFLPKEKMKVKLYKWLNDNVKRIGQASGKMVINGLAQDFPFDKKEGEFMISSYASGGDLLINSKWPLIKDIDAFIKVNKRDLNIDIVHADFQGTPVKQMNLRIDDIGNDKENLVVQGVVHGSAQKMLDFVLASPLQEKLTALKMVTIKGLLSLNLWLEIPLYPENDDNLAKGTLSFKGNTIIVKNQLKKIPLEEVAGDLFFDENGVNHSALTATVLGYPWNIKIQSEKIPQAATTIAVDGECSIESLKSRFNASIFPVLKGTFFLDARLKLSNDPKNLNSIHLKSSLKGLLVDLPSPLGKTRDTTTPLEINLDFNTKNTFHLKGSYHDTLSADLMLEENKGNFDLQSGELRLGSTQALNQNKPGLAIVGSLDGFDLQEWKKAIDKFSTEDSNNSLLQKLRIINLTLHQFTFLKQPFNQLTIRGKVRQDKEWFFNLKQKNLEADLTYNKSTETLSGFVKRLHLAPIETSKVDTDLPTILNPKQIPNLNLRIDNLSVGAIQIGDMTLKSHSTSEQWTIDYCKIDSPLYQFNIEGNWSQKGKKNLTALKLNLHLKNLAKSFERWHVTPAVHAEQGLLEFRGGWNRPIYDFSLRTLDGVMYLQLKNGRITHLSPETEEKLGLGKLLSILSLQTIPRRLKLDFSDLSHQGYSFDIFQGNFRINQGIMSTQDSYIEGPVAYASMKGELDLVRRMYDLNLRISPHITASLPLVATIAGGPIIGLAAWVANKIINQSMQKISAYSYKISGPWKEPIVQQLSIIRKNY